MRSPLRKESPTMSNHDQYPSTNDDGGVREQIPHSGVHHDETPVRDFDKTPLTQAYEQGLIQTPDSPAVLIAPEPRQERRIGWRKPVAVVALLGAGAAAAFGVTKGFSGDHSNAAPDRSPAASATPTPGSESTKPEKTPAAQPEFGFSAETYTNNPEKLMTDFADQINTWENSGFTEGVEDNAPRRFELGDDMAYAAEITAASNDAFANNVFADGWQTDEHITKFYKDAVFIHSDNIATALKTTRDANRDNKEHYVRTMEVVPGSVNAEVTENGDIKGTFDYQGHDNSDMNKAEDVLGGGIDPNSETGTYSVTFHDFGGKLMITDIEIQARANQS
jgi:hypothetical protein